MAKIDQQNHIDKVFSNPAESANKIRRLEEQVATVTRQRDLAVDALETVKLKSISLADAQVTSLEALTTIKGEV